MSDNSDLTRLQPDRSVSHHTVRRLCKLGELQSTYAVLPENCHPDDFGPHKKKRVAENACF